MRNGEDAFPIFFKHFTGLFPIKQRLPKNHLIEDGSSTKNIADRTHLHLLAIVDADYFRGNKAGSSASHVEVVAGIGMRGESEINNFGLPIGVDHDIFRFDVSVHNSCCLQLSQCRQNSFDDFGSS
jgi:hypothetical protein